MLSADHQQIRHELTRILESKYFSHSPTLSRFLKFVVESTLNGQGHLIKEYTVGKEILGKAENFDPKLNASVRIHAIRLRKLLAEYYQHSGNVTEIRIELPKGSYQPVFIPIDQYNSLYSGKTDPVVNDKEDTICIVPFTGFTLHHLPDFSILGFCEFLSDKLSLFQDIKVISFDTASKFMDEGGRLETIGKDLGVTYYLTGNIEIDDEKIRVSCQLFESFNNVFIRSLQFEVPLRSSTLMDATESITNQLVAALAGYRGIIHYNKLKDIHHPPPVTNKSANAIFWFYHYMVNHTPALFYEALQRLEALESEMGDCALCYAILAHLYTNAVVYNYQTTRDPLETARKLVNKAFEIDPDCQHAYIVMAWLHVFSRKKTEALHCLEKSIAINPYSPDFWGMCSLGLSLLGEYDKSLDYLKKSRELNPVPYWSAALPDYFWALKNNEYEKMLFYASKISTPQAIYEHIFEMMALYYLGRTDKLHKLIPDYLKRYPDGLSFAEEILPRILFDDELVEKILRALHHLRRMTP